MNWEQQYRRLVQLSRTLPAYPEQARDDAHLVSGCEAKVWLYVDSSDPDAVVVRFDSGSRIVKGLLALVQQQVDGQSLTAIQAFDIDTLFRAEGLEGHLTPSRANGLRNVAKSLHELTG
ncbi:cysteine desulfuration protein SufE [Idiomarina aquatica]|uniref:Cysteine desulfuration protein SufE n=1 Tax=Idiomarina aquatica TaxID=1327752 RepID=A0A4R6PSP4_9GAMM|nr:SufE family protein [Idiomarina aquatica]TDP40137.1 cysteine desulfuration protein SufE [Idiomarina aquatica]